MKTLPLTKGYVALVDDSDYDQVSQFKWVAMVHKRNVYACRSVTNDGKSTTQYLHRVVMGVTDPAIEIDHKDHNGLNCQRENLRHSTKISNAQNRRKRNGTSSMFKGVHFVNDKAKWKAEIFADRKRMFLGYHDSPIDAAVAYNSAANAHFGEFACLNNVGAQ